MNDKRNPGSTKGAQAQYHIDTAFRMAAEQVVKAMSDTSADGMVGRDSRKNALKALECLVAMAPMLAHNGDIGSLRKALREWRGPMGE